MLRLGGWGDEPRDGKPRWRACSRGSRAFPIQSGESSTIAASYAIQLLNLATGLILARGLAPVERGEVAGAIVWPVLTFTLVACGVGEAVAYRVAGDEERSNEWVGSGAAIFLLLAIGATTLCLAIEPTVVKGIPASLLFAYAFYPLLAALSTVAIQALLGRQDWKRYNLARLAVQSTTLVLLGLLLATRTLSPINILLSYLAAEAATAVYAWKLLHLRPSSRSMGSNVRRLLSFGWRSHIGTVATNVAERGDQLVLVSMLSPREFGIYVVAVSFSSPIAVAGGSLAPLAMSRVARLGGQSSYMRTILGTCLAALMTSAVITAVMMWLIPPVINSLLGPSYSEAGQLAQHLSLLAPLIGLNRVLLYAIQGLGRPTMPGLYVGISAAIGMLLLVVMLPMLGVGAAVYASGVSYSLSTVLLSIYLWWVHSRRSRSCATPRNLAMFLEEPQKSKTVGY